MKNPTGTWLIIMVMFLTLLSGCQALQSNTNPIESTTVKEVPANEPQNNDPKNNAPNNNGATGSENKTKPLLFDIYSDKDNLAEAVKEISLKHIEEVKSESNKRYTEQGVRQRIDDVRLGEISSYGDEYKNIVEGGNLYIYSINFELKPRYPNDFTQQWVFESLQKNGWILFEGTYLIVYHPNSTIDAPYYLASAALFDEFSGGAAEEKLAKIVKERIPQLKLLNAYK